MRGISQVIILSVKTRTKENKGGKDNEGLVRIVKALLKECPKSS